MLRVVAFVACVVAVLSAPVLDDELNNHWEMYKSAHSKSYSSPQEETLRRMIWEGHVEYIAKHNREYDFGMHTYTVGLNEYADMTNQEFRATMNGYRGMNRTGSGSTFLCPSHVQVPAAVDWRPEGYVTAVKNQGQCGSCWAFSTTGSLEGQHFKATGKLVSLSEQNLVDCSKAEGNNGCKGGLMDDGFQYIVDAGGIDTEDSYPYTGRDGRCKFSKSNIGATDTGFTDIAQGDESALQAAAATVGPIAVAIDASHYSFQLYRSGVYNERSCSSSKLDHGVLVVGYDTDGSKPYWIVKNSWGGSWGQEGYIWMSRNKNNQCGIASAASYPTV